jgi:N-acetylmuramoyl-L-alanine amidase
LTTNSIEHTKNVGAKLRPIQKVIIHCSATDEEIHDNIEWIDKLHRSFGWDSCGYNFFINKQGGCYHGRPVHVIPAATKGHNKTSIAICVGGLKYFKPVQFESLKKLCLNLVVTHGLTHENIHAHNEFNKNKTCPVFNIEPIKDFVDKQTGGRNGRKRD